VVGQEGRIEADRQRIAHLIRSGHLRATERKQGQHAEHERQQRPIPAIAARLDNLAGKEALVDHEVMPGLLPARPADREASAIVTNSSALASVCDRDDTIRTNPDVDAVHRGRSSAESRLSTKAATHSDCASGTLRYAAARVRVRHDSAIFDRDYHQWSIRTLR